MTREEFIARIVNFVDIGCGRPDLVVEARYLAADLWDQVASTEVVDLREGTMTSPRPAGATWPAGGVGVPDGALQDGSIG